MIQGKTALITGSTSGIGLGIAEAFAAAGAHVLISGSRSSPEAEALAVDIAERHGVRVALACGDLSAPKTAEALVAAAREKLGPVDILVNNAGIQHVAPIEEFPAEKWDLILALNLSAAFHLSRLVFADMKARRFGRIINIASAHGLVASPYKAAYVAAKHGLVGLTKVLALEGAEFGVTANTICPGYVMTPLVEKQIDDQAKAHGIARERVINDVILAPQPMKRFAEVSEIGSLAVLLAGPAGTSITGAALPVDGGWTAR